MPSTALTSRDLRRVLPSAPAIAFGTLLLVAIGSGPASPSEPAGVQLIRPGETLQAHLPPEMAIPSLADVEEFNPGGYNQAKVLALPFPIPNAVLFETEAEEAGPLTVEAASLDFNTAIRISRAGPEGEATILKADDDSGTGSNSRLVIKAEAGARYRIEVFRFKLPDVVTAGSEFEISVRAGKPERQGLAERNQADWEYWQQVEAVAHRNGDPGRVWSAVFGQGWLLSGWDPLPASGGVPRAHHIFTKALEIAEANFGPRHLLTAVTLEAYGHYEYMAGDADKAQDALERSLEIKESLAGPENEVVANAKVQVGLFCAIKGQNARAKALLDEAGAFFEKKKTDGWAPMMVLFMQADRACRDGQDDKARDLWGRCGEMVARLQEEDDHPKYLIWQLGIYVQRGRCLLPRGEYAEARSFFEQGERYYEEKIKDRLLKGPAREQLIREMAEQMTEMRHFHAKALEVEGSYKQARDVLEKALQLMRDHVKPISPLSADHWISGLLAGQAELSVRLGDHERAKSLALEALSIAEKAFGPDHSWTTRIRVGVARTLAAVGEQAAALEAALRSDAVVRDRRRLQARASHEVQALRATAQGSPGLDLAVTLAEHRMDGRPDAAAEVWDALIRSRAMVLDQIASRHVAIAGSGDPELTRLAEEHDAASVRLANLMVRGPSGQSRQDHRRAVEAAKAMKAQAEEALAARSEKFRKARLQERAGLEEVLWNLPEGSALVGIRVHRSPTFPPPPGPPPNRSAYTAFVVNSPRSKPVIVPLGPAEKIDEAVECWREAVTASAGARREACDLGHREAGSALRELVWDPIAARLGEVKRVFIVPDGDLHFVDFAAFPVGADRYLLEEGPAIQYLSSERDLVLPPIVAKLGKGMLALGDPAFDAESTFAALRKSGPRNEAPVRIADAGSTFRGPRSECEPFTSHRFEPLPASGDEVAEVAASWPRPDEVETLTGAAATEGAFKREAPGRRVLHLATHGFYLGGDACPSALGDHRGFGKVVAEDDEREMPPLQGENPLVLSGLVLAGANNREHAGEDEDDGILTAQEIAAMDLSSVEWAVLSACDTGVGKVLAGEGVSGLRRAFQIAGADTLIMSLWPVEEDFARRWMKALYDGRLEKRLDTAEAVRQASLTVLNDRRARGLSDHPLYWAGFVAAGDWR